MSLISAISFPEKIESGDDGGVFVGSLGGVGLVFPDAVGIVRSHVAMGCVSVRCRLSMTGPIFSLMVSAVDVGGGLRGNSLTLSCTEKKLCGCYPVLP